MKYVIHVIFYIGLLFAAPTKAQIDIQPGLSGIWTVDASGQGLSINIARVNEQPVLVVTWYSYMGDNQVWLLGSELFEYGVQQLNVSMVITSGANWGANFRSEDVIRTEWGNITLEFSGCNTGLLNYIANDNTFGSGSLVITRLTNTDGVSCHENNNNEAEKQSLSFMREEEKMARDVYLEFNRIYRKNIFLNISDSEQTHMDAVLNLMNIYNVPDSSTGVEGTFNNLELQILYDTLIEQGMNSLGEAYLASALIEETDIWDLIQFEDNDVMSSDILETYDNLLCGSRNHLRSFVTKYESETGNQYSVQIPDLTDIVHEILNSDNEQCGQ